MRAAQLHRVVHNLPPQMRPRPVVVAKPKDRAACAIADDCEERFKTRAGRALHMASHFEGIR